MNDELVRTPETSRNGLRQSYLENGFAVLHNALPPDAVDACAAALSSLRRKHADLDVRATAPASERFEAMCRLVSYAHQEPDVEAIALNATVCAALRAMFGAEPVARYTRLLEQSPGAIPANSNRRGTPHLHNFGMATRPTGGRAIVWTPVDDVHPDAGPMWFLPESHRVFVDFPERLLDAVPGSRDQLHAMWSEGASAERWLEWHGGLGDRSMEILADWMDEAGAKPVPVLLRRGDVLIFSNDLLHGTLAARDPSLPRRIMFTHYHALDHELWEIGDALGSDINAAGSRCAGDATCERRDGGLVDPGAFRRFYASMNGFFGPR